MGKKERCEKKLRTLVTCHGVPHPRHFLCLRALAAKKIIRFKEEL